MDMITQLRAVRNRYDEINNQLQDPTVINNNELYRSLMKDYKNLTPIVEAYDAYDAAKGAFDEAKEMLDEGGLDAEFKELAQAEYEENKEKMAFLEERLKILLLPKDEMMTGASLWRSEAARAAKKPPCLRTVCSACIRCMPKREAGNMRC